MASTFTDPFFPTITAAIVQARLNEYAFMLWMNDGTEGDEQFCERIMSNSLSDGILLVSAFADDPLIPHLLETNFPFVLIGSRPTHPTNINYVDFDNVAGARAAVSHLLQLGRKRIGIITGPADTFASRERLAGYTTMLTDAGTQLDKALIAEGDYTERSGYMRAKILLTKKVDAIFATSDIMALGALRAIKDQGLRVPDDVSVIGFDDLLIASLASPPLTSVRQPITDVVSTATQLLIDWLEGKLSENFQIVLPVELVVRETCGASLRR
jgi:DNA-binding LacI/PurR family transcriptional regulator